MTSTAATPPTAITSGGRASSSRSPLAKRSNRNDARRAGGVGECSARTQGASIALLSGRLRTRRCAAQRGRAAQSLIPVRLLGRREVVQQRALLVQVRPVPRGDTFRIDERRERP